MIGRGFRIWSFFENRYHYENIYLNPKGEAIVSRPGNTAIVKLKNYKVCTDTGVPDKNGAKIFEGSILNVTEESKGEIYEWVTDVVFDGNGFFFKGYSHLKGEADDYHGDPFDIEWYKGTVFPQRTFEVIGNIHENPELLEQSS